MSRGLILALAIAVTLASAAAGTASAKPKWNPGDGPCGPKDPTCVCTVIWNGKCPKK
jgi:hypothetical protein